MAINVDHQAIARGLYDMFNDNERACVSIGMLPESKMSILRDSLTTKAQELILMEFTGTELASLGDIGAQIGKDILSQRAKWVQGTEHEIAVAIYGVAKDLGAMIA